MLYLSNVNAAKIEELWSRRLSFQQSEIEHYQTVKFRKMCRGFIKFKLNSTISEKKLNKMKITGLTAKDVDLDMTRNPPIDKPFGSPWRSSKNSNTWKWSERKKALGINKSVGKAFDKICCLWFAWSILRNRKWGRNKVINT